ncbi:hypothetical protein [Spirillospora sp. CA-294931]|uniref:hypothetical protein n=1 Tax=Spirillospora sp. CA-294931 TaxID=3240042 RepID=UPI003D8DD13E
MTFKKQTIQIQAHGDLGDCDSPSNPKITGGVFRLVGSGTGNCTGPFAVGHGKLTISWSDGTSSTISQTGIRIDAHTWSLDGGVVSEGPFRSQTSSVTGRSTGSLIEWGERCITSGVTTYTGATESFSIGST